MTEGAAMNVVAVLSFLGATDTAATTAQSVAITLGYLGLAGTGITTLGVIIAAVINNRRERKGSGEAGVELTLRERIVLKEEKIQDLTDRNHYLRNENEDLTRKNDDLTYENQQLHEELASLRGSPDHVDRR